MYCYRPHLKQLARDLRKSMTETEIRFWARIRNRQINNLLFHRQKPIGKYIVDFYCPVRKLIVEIDGGQHYEDSGREKDIERDNYFQNILGLKVLRFTTLDILNNIEGVIIKLIQETT